MEDCFPLKLRQEHLDGAKLYADRYEMIRAIGSSLGLKIVAEVGVAFGGFSEHILKSLRPSRFDAYDVFDMHKWPAAWGKPTRDTLGDKTHHQWYCDRFADEIKNGVLHTYFGDSSTMLQERENQFYDMIYIDGAHDLEGVRKDADVARKKIKAEGVLIFNDYIMYDHKLKMPYGIVPVVNDLCVNHGWRITHFALNNEMFCDVALQR